MRKRRDPRTTLPSRVPRDGAPPDQAAVERALRAILDRLKPRDAAPRPTTGAVAKDVAKSPAGTTPASAPEEQR